MVQRPVSYVPGLYKIFDEILVNASDNKQRDPTMDCVKVVIDVEQVYIYIMIWGFVHFLHLGILLVNVDGFFSGTFCHDEMLILNYGSYVFSS